MVGDVEFGYLEGGRRKVGRIHFGLRKTLREQDGQATGARAHIGHALNLLDGRQPARDGFWNQLNKVGTRHDDPFIDTEAQAAQPGFANEVGRGDAFENAAFEQGEELGLLGGFEGALKALRELFPSESRGRAHQGQRFLLLIEEPLAVGHVGRLKQFVREAQVLTARAQTRGLGRSRARRCAHQRFAVLR